MKINGKPVVDATKPIIVTVTKRDVKNGQRKDPGGCAMALAAKRTCHAKSARVHVGRTYIEYDDKWVRYNTSNSLRTELVSFDRGQVFLEGDFRLSAIPPHDRTTNKDRFPKPQGSRKNDKNRKARIARVKHHVTEGIRARGANR